MGLRLYALRKRGPYALTEATKDMTQLFWGLRKEKALRVGRSLAKTHKDVLITHNSMDKNAQDYSIFVKD